MKRKTRKETEAVEEYVRYLEYKLAETEFTKARILGAVKALEALHLITEERAEGLRRSIEEKEHEQKG